MKIKTAELTGSALDWAVAKCEGRDPSHYLGVVRATAHPDCPDSAPMFGPELQYSTDWAQGGPILHRELISVSSQTNGHSWAAKGAHNYSYGPTPLIAAMRCYVASKLGDEVDVPKELVCTS